MKKLFSLMAMLFLTLGLSAQTLQTFNPIQIRPSTTNNYVLTTVSGQTVWAPSVATTAIQMQVVPPVAGQSVTLYPNGVSTTQPPPGNGSALADTKSGIFNFYASISGGNSAATWSGFALPAYVTPANVTAVYAVALAGVPANKIVANINNPSAQVTCGTSLHPANVFVNGAATFPQQPVNLAQFSALLPLTGGTDVPNITCQALMVGANTAFGGSAELDVPAIALVVYYTGTPPPVNNIIQVVPPLDYSSVNNSLSTGQTTTAEALSFSATPTFSTITNASRIPLLGNITSFTLGVGTDGQTKTLCFQQGSGPWTVTAPANVHGFFTIGTTNAKWNCQSFTYDNGDAIWLAVSTGVINQ